MEGPISQESNTACTVAPDTLTQRTQPRNVEHLEQCVAHKAGIAWGAMLINMINCFLQSRIANPS